MLRSPSPALGWFGWVELGVLWVMFGIGCWTVARAVRDVVARRRHVDKVRLIEHVGCRRHPASGPGWQR